MTSHKGSNGEDSCNLKKKIFFFWVQFSRELRQEGGGDENKKGEKNGSALFCKSQRFFKFIE